MIRLVIFFLMSVGTLFFYSPHFVDAYLVPKWSILAIGGVAWGIITSIHWIRPFDYHTTQFHIFIECGLVVIIVIEACYGIYQLIEADSYQVTSMTGSQDNVAGFAACLCAGLPLCLQLTIQPTRLRLLGLAAVIIVITAVLLSFSRAGILSVFTVLILWSLKILNLSKKVKWTILLSLLLFLTVTLYWIKKDSADGRLLIWHCSLKMIKDHPLLGWGIGGFEAHYMDYQAAYFKQHPNSRYTLLADTVQYPFNEYLNIGVNFGAIGLLGIFLLSRFLKYIYVQSPTPKKEYSLYVWGAVGIFAIFSYPLMYPFVWLMLAYATGQLLKKPTTIRPIYLRTGALCLLIGCYCIGIWTYHRIKAELNWTKAITFLTLGQTSRAMEMYQIAYPILSTDRYFLYNYAAELFQYGAYDKAIQIAKKCKLLWTDYDLELLLASLYEQQHNEIKAEAHYKQASLMCPNRFIPLYHLVLLLDRTKQSSKAIQLARHIVKKPIKVPSLAVNRIKEEMNDYIIKKVKNNKNLKLNAMKPPE